MKLIVGLGNPGEKYINNRHNAGFMFVDYIADQFKHQASDFKQEKFNVESSMLNDPKILLIKPQTFMNKSGLAVKNVIDYYKISIQNIVVAHDDLDILLGDFKIQSGTGPKLHNGISSIEDALDTSDFLRLRIGVEDRSPETKIDGKTYVLSDFTQEQRKSIDEVFPKIYERLDRQFLNLAS